MRVFRSPRQKEAKLIPFWGTKLLRNAKGSKKIKGVLFNMKKADLIKKLVPAIIATDNTPQYNHRGKERLLSKHLKLPFLQVVRGYIINVTKL